MVIFTPKPGAYQLFPTKILLTIGPTTFLFQGLEILCHRENTDTVLDMKMTSEPLKE